MHNSEKKSIITGAAEVAPQEAEALIKEAIPQERPVQKKSPAPMPPLPDGFRMLQQATIEKLEDIDEGRSIPVSFAAGLYYKAERARLHTVENAHTGKKEIVKAFMPHWICPAFHVTAEINNQKRTDRALLFEWQDKKGVSHRKEVRPGYLHQNKERSDLFAELTQNGLTVPTDTKARQCFQNFIEKIYSKKYLTRFEAVGWNRLGEKDFFTLSDGKSYPEDEGVYIPDLTNGGNSLYAQKGTLQDWKASVAAYADKNKMLALAISLSFAGSLLKFSEMEGGGINFVGNSKTGKTTSLSVAASVWGEPSNKGQVQSWRTTDNALENIAESLNDNVLFIDEMGEAKDKDLSKSAYMLANGRGKSRFTERAVKTWLLLFFSTSEKPLRDLIEQMGEKSNAGQEVRIVDLRADNGRYGAFDEIYSFKSGGDFVVYLNEAVKKNYGIAGDEWLKELVKKDFQELRKRIRADIAAFIEAVYPEKEKRGQVITVLKRFALCAVAGELAAEWYILPWEKGTATSLILEIAKGWLAERGTGSIEEMRILAEFKRIMEMEEERFQLEGSDLTPRNKLGWKKPSLYDGYSYFLTSSGLKDIFKGEVKFAKKILLERGILEEAKTEKISRAGAKWVYPITNRWEGGASASGNFENPF